MPLTLLNKISNFCRILIAIYLPLFLLSCSTGPENFVGVGVAELAQTDTRGLTSHNIFVATTRARSNNPDEFFTGERSAALGLGNVVVTVPPVHKVGKIEQSSTGRVDPRQHFTIGKPQIYANPRDFAQSLELALTERDQAGREVLIFVHGYNTNFSEAVLRVTQFVHDTGFKGIPLLFSWASRGQAVDYVYDINSALQARFFLQQLAVQLSTVDVEAVTMVAHSMGNLVTLEAMAALARRNDFKKRDNLRAVILAAPDVDYDLFRIEIFSLLARNFLSLACRQLANSYNLVPVNISYIADLAGFAKMDIA